MKNTKYLLISTIPGITILWGVFMLLFFDPFYSGSADPEYPYLVNGLNCAVFRFNFIGLVEHPGTPFHIYNGIIIKLTHIVTGKEEIIYDVFARPEHYLSSISLSLTILQSLLLFFVGRLGFKKQIPIWQIVILQASFLFSDLLIWLFCRVTPDRFFMMSALLFLLIYLKHSYGAVSERKFALWAGVPMALGLATKFNFFPILFLPILFLNTNKNRFIYGGSTIIFFLIFISPILDKFKDYTKFLSSIFNHDGLYGSGEQKIFSLGKLKESLLELFRINPELLVLIVVLLLLLLIALAKKNKRFIFILSGYTFIIALEIIMVSKHFKNYYLAPIFTYYAFVFFTLIPFLAEIGRKKKKALVLSLFLPALFILTSFVKVSSGIPSISKQIDERNKLREFVLNNIKKSDVWFIEPTWESGAHIENALVYGLSYCAHRDQYIPELKKVNPNVITYEGENQQVRLWRGVPISLDSIMAMGSNIHVYSTPGRHASVLIKILEDEALSNHFQLSEDTVFSDDKSQTAIIRLRVVNKDFSGTNSELFEIKWQKEVDKYKQAIKNTPEWLEKVKEKAIQKNISLDSMILLDAIWMVKNSK